MSIRLSAALAVLSVLALFASGCADHERVLKKKDEQPIAEITLHDVYGEVQALRNDVVSFAVEIEKKAAELSAQIDAVAENGEVSAGITSLMFLIALMSSNDDTGENSFSELMSSLGDLDMDNENPDMNFEEMSPSDLMALLMMLGMLNEMPSGEQFDMQGNMNFNDHTSDSVETFEPMSHSSMEDGTNVNEVLVEPDHESGKSRELEPMPTPTPIPIEDWNKTDGAYQPPIPRDVYDMTDGNPEAALPE